MKKVQSKRRPAASETLLLTEAHRPSTHGALGFENCKWHGLVCINCIIKSKGPKGGLVSAVLYWDRQLMRDLTISLGRANLPFSVSET